MGGWFRQIIKSVCGPSCKLRLAKISTELSLHDGPSVAISTKPGYKEPELNKKVRKIDIIMENHSSLPEPRTSGQKYWFIQEILRFTSNLCQLTQEGCKY